MDTSTAPATQPTPTLNSTAQQLADLDSEAVEALGRACEQIEVAARQMGARASEEVDFWNEVGPALETTVKALRVADEAWTLVHRLEVKDRRIAERYDEEVNA